MVTWAWQAAELAELACLTVCVGVEHVGVTSRSVHPACLHLRVPRYPLCARCVPWKEVSVMPSCVYRSFAVYVSRFMVLMCSL